MPPASANRSGTTWSLDSVDLTVQTGAVFALLGPNGAGKTTMVRILATLVRPDGGTAVIAGHDLLTDPVGVKNSISLTGQQTAVDDLLTGKENLLMMGRLRRLPRRAAAARAADLLATFDLAEAADRRAGTYSGGMMRRLELAISMIERPALLFLDEPTTGLDPRSREQLWATVRGLTDDGVTILLTTQYLEEADVLADQIALLDHGRMDAQGTADELKSSIGSEVVEVQFADPAAYDVALGLLDPIAAELRLRIIQFATDGSAAQLHSALGRLQAAGAPALKVSIHRPSLDDVFFSLTGANHARPLDGAHLYWHASQSRCCARDRILRDHPGRICRLRVLFVPASDSSVTGAATRPGGRSRRSTGRSDRPGRSAPSGR